MAANRPAAYRAARAASLAAVVAALCVAAAGAAAQEISAFASRGRTAAPGWERLRGWGIAVAFPVHAHLRARVGFAGSTGDWERVGPVCDGQSRLSAGCREERIVTQSTLRGVRLSVLARAGGRRAWIAAGGGVSLSGLRVRDRSESGRPTPLVAPTGAQAGLLALARAGMRPLPVLPLGVFAEATWHHVHFDGGCAVEAFYVDLHCGSARLAEARLGLSWTL